MKSKRALIQDFSRPTVATVTVMQVTDIDNNGESMFMFTHPDGSMTIINMMPGWVLTVSGKETK